MVRLPPSPLPPFSHIKARLFTLDVSKAGPRYPLLPDPFPEGPDYPGVHRPIPGGVRGAPGQAGAQARHPQPHAAPASSVPGRHRPVGLRGTAAAVEKWLDTVAVRAGCELPGVTAAGRAGALGAAAGHGHHGFIGHAGPAAPGGVSPGMRRQGGTPSCPSERLGARGMI